MMRNEKMRTRSQYQVGRGWSSSHAGTAVNARRDRDCTVVRLEETVIQLQAHLEEYWGALNARYVLQAFATIQAAAFDPKRATIAGMYRVATPLFDVIGGDSIDPGELLVLMVYRPPVDDTPSQEHDPLTEVTASVAPAHAASWFHEHARILLITLSSDGGKVWILGCANGGEEQMPNSQIGDAGGTHGTVSDTEKARAERFAAHRLHTSAETHSSGLQASNG